MRQDVPGLNWLQLCWEHLAFLPDAVLQDLRGEIFWFMGENYKVLRVTAVGKQHIWQEVRVHCSGLDTYPACPLHVSTFMCLGRNA